MSLELPTIEVRQQRTRARGAEDSATMYIFPRACQFQRSAR